MRVDPSLRTPLEVNAVMARLRQWGPSILTLGKAVAKQTETAKPKENPMTAVERILATIEIDGRTPELMSRLLKAQAAEAYKTWKPPRRVRRKQAQAHRKARRARSHELLSCTR